ncbi:MAG: metallophosphoesterase [bacterium]|nr:metallophosphoesterase [bacterium]
MQAEEANFTFVHFTDTHMMAGATFTLSDSAWEVDTQATLERVIRAINALQPQPVFVVIGGDLSSPDLIDRSRCLTSEAYEPSYRLLQQTLEPLNCPVYMLMGNHDDRAAFHRVMQHAVVSPDAPHYFSFNHDGYHFIGLDTQEPGKPGGYVDAQQLDWLRDDLLAHRGVPTLTFMHHHPWPVDIDWLDVQHLRNGDDLVHLFRDHGDVRWMICGHVHLEQNIQRDGLTQLTSPSTCFQISQVSQTRKIFAGPPGFRVVRVKGLQLSTQVLYLHDDRDDAL